jgi:hypothetical protein
MRVARRCRTEGRGGWLRLTAESPAERGQGGQVWLQVFHGKLGGIAPGEEEEGGRGGAVEVGAGTGPAGYLLEGDVARSADEGGARIGRSTQGFPRAREVHEIYATDRSQQHVARIHVAVDDWGLSDRSAGCPGAKAP